MSGENAGVRGVHADLRERAGVEEQVQALADGQLAGRMLACDGVLPAHPLRNGAAPREVVGEVLHRHGQALALSVRM
jgi:hypothetical protein